MRWWPLFGLARRLTEKRAYGARAAVGALPGFFRRSLFVYAVDVGTSNALNIEIAALRTPQYNIHRFGIFFTDTPRHADLLLVLGRPTKKTSLPLARTIAQIPRPFGIVHLVEPFQLSDEFVEVELPEPVARIEGLPAASEILAVLLQAQRGGKG